MTRCVFIFCLGTALLLGGCSRFPSPTPWVVSQLPPLVGPPGALQVHAGSPEVFSSARTCFVEASSGHAPLPEVEANLRQGLGRTLGWLPASSRAAADVIVTYRSAHQFLCLHCSTADALPEWAVVHVITNDGTGQLFWWDRTFWDTPNRLPHLFVAALQTALQPGGA